MTDIENTNIESKNVPVEPAETDKKIPVEQSETEKYGKVIAGVKKEFRAKGYNEGYEAAKSESERTVEKQPDEPKKDEVTEKPDINMDKLTDIALDKLRRQQSIEQIKNVNAQAFDKYDNFQEILDEADIKARDNPTFAALGHVLYQLDNPEILHTVLTDASIRVELLDMNPNKWKGKLREISKMQSPEPKVAPDPIEEVKGSPGIGEQTKTRADLRKRSKLKYKR